MLAVGDGKLLENGKRSAMQIKDGDTIVFSAYAGSTVEVEGEEYLVITETDVLAVVE